MQQPGLPGKALKGFFVLPGQALHTLVIKFIGQGTGGLHQNAAAAPANLLLCPGQGAAPRRTGPVFAVLSAAVRRAHLPHGGQGPEGREVRRRPMGKAVFFRQSHQPLHWHPPPS